MKFVKDFIQVCLDDPPSKKILLFLTLNASFMALEFIYGYLSNSLGLISDSFHMMFDSLALLVGLIASFVAKQKSNDESKFTFGLAKIETLAGLLNGIFLIFVSYNLMIKSVDRIMYP